MFITLKIEISKVFVQTQNHLKINIQVRNHPHKRLCKFQLNWISSF